MSAKDFLKQSSVISTPSAVNILSSLSNGTTTAIYFDSYYSQKTHTIRYYTPTQSDIIINDVKILTLA